MAGLDQRQLAKKAGIDASTLSRMESAGAKTARGHGSTIEVVIEALARCGVELADDGSIRPIPKKR